MLLICPHCSDIAEIPSIFHKFYGMPIACHACEGVFYVPTQKNNPESRAVRDQNRKTRCSSCQVALLIPDLSNIPRQDHPVMECPACRGNVLAPRMRANVRSGEMVASVIVGGGIGALIIGLDRYGIITADVGGLGQWLGTIASDIQSMINTAITYISVRF